MPPTHLTVWTTTDTEAHAQELAEAAIRSRTAACAQIDGPIRSTYRWQNEIRTDQEWRVLFKTPTASYGALESLLRATHTYDTPEIIATPITAGSEDYLNWLETETN